MKTAKKTVAVILGALMIGSSLSGCVQATVFGKYPQDLSWSYKDDHSQMTIGEYIYYNYSSFSSASSKVENGTGDFLDQKLKDDDDKEMTARAYIEKNTDEACKHFLYVNKTFDELKLSLTQDEISSYKATADQYWVYYKTSFEAMGISKESFVEAGYANNTKLEKIFKATYQKGGKKEVSADELKKYYEKEYVNYNYVSLPLYDEETEDATENTAESTEEHTHQKKSDKDIKAIKTNFEKYVKAINEGTSYADEVKVYMDDYKIDSDPTISATNKLEDSGLGEELKKAFEELKDKKAKYIVVGEDGDAPMIYLLYRGDIKEESKKLAENEELSYSVLIGMKSEEFQEDIKKAVKEYKCEINTKATEKYPMTMFITEPATSATEDEIADDNVDTDVSVISQE